MVKKSAARKKGKPTKTKTKKIAKRGKTTTSRISKTRSKKSKKSSKSRAGHNKKPKQAFSKTVPQKDGIVVRIMGHAQYRLDSVAAEKLNEIDNEIVKFVQAVPHESGPGGDGVHQKFQKMLGEMTLLVTRKGKLVPMSEIIPSDLILPPRDISIDGARELFEGEGLIPG